MTTPTEILEMSTVLFVVGLTIGGVWYLGCWTMEKMAHGSHVVMDWLEKRDRTTP